MQLFSEELFHPFQVWEYSSKVHHYQIPIVEKFLDSLAMQSDILQSFLLHLVSVVQRNGIAVPNRVRYLAAPDALFARRAG